MMNMFQTQGRKKAAAILFIASGILLLFSLTLPYWKIQVMAPQYPKGLGVSIYVDHLAGDVREIDGLNHYIGMKLLGRAAQLERKLAVLGVIAIALAAFASIFARKYFALVLILPILLFPFLFAADLFAWLAYYGLSLDPHAPFSSSIKPFIPPLFGKGVIGQFKALASFQTGFYFSLIASFLSSIGILLRFSARKINFPALMPAISVTGVTVLSFCFGLPEAYAKTISVTSPEAMRQALAGAGEGDMIEVSPGVYPGPWVIEKPVKLAGINFPILDGGGKGTVIKLAAPNIEIKGFVIRGSGDSLALEDTGILAEAPNALIEDNRLEDVLFGISVQHAPNTIVRNNHLSSKKLPVARRGDLIRVWYSDGVILEGNHTWEGRDAVLWFSKRLLVRGNVFQKSRYALHFMYCDDARVENNVFQDNSVGAYLMYSNRIQLSGNKITNNRGPSGFGVGFKDMEEARIYANLIANNKTGFYFDSASGIYEENLIAYNDIGVEMLPSSGNNRFSKNSFIENGEQVVIQSMGSGDRNLWLENYWSDYRGFDTNHDGIGEMPYASFKLFERVRDRYPALKLFASSPSGQGIDLASSLFPLFSPQPKFKDKKPLVTPHLSQSQKVSGNFSWPFVLAGGAFFLPILGLTIATRRRFYTVSQNILTTPPRQALSRNKSLEAPMKENPAIQVCGLTKTFGKINALDNVSFEVKKGETLILWGTNGAGKTTLLRSMLAVIPYSGRIEIFGRDAWENPKWVREQIGYVPQEIHLYEDQTVWEAALFFAALRRVPCERVKTLIREWGLEESRTKKVAELSGGMKQKLALVIALLSDPPIIFLDEATNHLDVRTRREFIMLLARLKNMGKTLILCSHRLGEVWRLTHRVVVLEKGRKIEERNSDCHLG